MQSTAAPSAPRTWQRQVRQVQIDTNPTHFYVGNPHKHSARENGHAPVLRPRTRARLSAEKYEPLELSERRAREEVAEEEGLQWLELKRLVVSSKNFKKGYDLYIVEGSARDILRVVESGARVILETRIRVLKTVVPALLDLQRTERAARLRVGEEEKGARDLMQGHYTQDVAFMQRGVRAIGDLHPTSVGLKMHGPNATCSFSCHHITEHYIVCGTRNGTIHMFDRDTHEEACYFAVHTLGGQLGDVVTGVTLSSDEKFVAFATSSGTIVLTCIAQGRCVTVQRHNLHAQTVTALLLTETQSASGKTCVFLSGDASGKVVMLQTSSDFLPPQGSQAPVSHEQPPKTLLSAAGGPIVQLSARNNIALVASTVRTYTIHLADPQLSVVPVGSQPHKKPAKYGACSISNNILFVSRAKGNLWKAAPDTGKVLSTLKFPEDMAQVCRPSSLFPISAVPNYVVALSDSHLTLLDVHTVSVVWSLPIFSVISIANYKCSFFTLCEKLGSKETLMLQFDFTSLIISGVLQSEVEGRKLLLDIQDAEWASITQQWRSELWPELEFLCLPRSEWWARSEIELQASLQSSCSRETVERESLENEWEISWVKTRLQLRAPLEVVNCCGFEEAARVLIKQTQEETWATVSCLLSEQLEVFQAWDSGCSSIKVEESKRRQALEFQAWQNQHIAKLFQPVREAESEERTALLREEAQSRYRAVIFLRAGYQLTTLFKRNLQERGHIWQEEVVAWGRLSKALSQAKEALTTIVREMYKMWRFEVESRSKIYLTQEEIRLRMMAYEKRQRAVIQDRDLVRTETQTRWRIQGDQAMIRADLEMQATNARRRLEFQRVSTLLSHLLETEPIIRAKIEAENDTIRKDLVYFRKLHTDGLFQQAEKVGRQIVFNDEATQWNIIIDAHFNVLYILKEVQERMEVNYRAEDAQRKIVARDQLVEWKELLSAAKSEKSDLTKYLKKKASIQASEVKKRDTILRNEQKAFLGILHEEERDRFAEEEAKAREGEMRNMQIHFPEVAAPYLDWIETISRNSVVASEEARWQLLLDYESKREVLGRIETFEKATSAFLKSALYRDYLLHKEHGYQWETQPESYFFEEGDKWLTYFHVARDLGYLLPSDRGINETFAKTSNPLLPSFSSDPESSSFGAQTESDLYSPYASEETLEACAKLVGFYLLVNLKYWNLREDKINYGERDSHYPADGEISPRTPHTPKQESFNTDTDIQSPQVPSLQDMVVDGVLTCNGNGTTSLSSPGLPPFDNVRNTSAADMDTCWQRLVPSLSRGTTPTHSRRGSAWSVGAATTMNIDGQPLEEWVLDLMVSVWAMSKDAIVDWEPIALVCHQLNLKTAFICLQRMHLPSIRLPSKEWDPEYLGDEEHILAFFKNTEPTFSAEGGNYVDTLLLAGDVEALLVIKRLSRISFTIWYMPYLLVVAQGAAMAYVSELYPEIHWYDVLRSLSSSVLREVHKTLNLEYNDQAAVFQQGLFVDYLSGLAIAHPMLCTNRGFVKTLLTKMARIISRCCQMPIPVERETEVHYTNKAKSSFRSEALEEELDAVPQRSPLSQNALQIVIIMKQCEQRIRDILEDPDKYCYDREDVARIFVNIRYWQGLLLLGMHEVYYQILLENGLVNQIIMHINGRPFDEQHTAWISLLRVAHFMSRTEDDCINSPTSPTSSYGYGCNSPWPTGRAYSQSNLSGFLYSEQDQDGDGEEDEEEHSILEDSLSPLLKVVLMLFGLQGRQFTMHLIEDALPDEDTKRIQAQLSDLVPASYTHKDNEWVELAEEDWDQDLEWEPIDADEGASFTAEADGVAKMNIVR